MLVDGNKIKRIRENQGMTARDLAKAASVSPAHLSLIEHGHRNPGPHAIARIAKVLETSIVELRKVA